MGVGTRQSNHSATAECADQSFCLVIASPVSAEADSGQASPARPAIARIVDLANQTVRDLQGEREDNSTDGGPYCSACRPESSFREGSRELDNSSCKGGSVWQTHRPTRSTRCCVASFRPSR